MGEPKNGDSQSKVMWAVITGLAITAATGWYQAGQKATVDLAVLQATVARDSKDTNRRLDEFGTELRRMATAIEELREEKRTRRRQQEREEQ